MTWELFYLVCCVVGLVLCAVSVLGGAGHGSAGHIHMGGHLPTAHVGGHLPHAHVASPRLGTHAAHASSTASSPNQTVSPINGFTLTAFLCWFGGAGYLLRTQTSFVVSVSLLLATVSGIAGGALIFWFLSSVLLPHERALSAEETEIVGVVGRLSGPLGAASTGELLYSQLGARRSAPARSEDGSAIDRNAEVIVLRYERGIAYVRLWEDLAP